MSDLDRYALVSTVEITAGLTHHRAIAQLRACRPIPEVQVREICYKAREPLIEEGNVVGVNAPVTVGERAEQKRRKHTEHGADMW